MTARIANRNGEPAWKNAPPRLRQSQIERVPLEQPRPSVWDRLRTALRAQEAIMGDLVERLRSHTVLHEGPPITVIWDGVETVCNGGRATQLRNPDGPEAADEIECLHARVAELEARGGEG